MKNKPFKIITLSIALLSTIILVQNCAVLPLSSEPINFRKETAENGLIVGSITFPREFPRFNGYYISVIRKDNNKKISRKNSTEIEITPEQIWRDRHIGQLNNGLTYLFAIERQEGEYEISSIRLFTNSGNIAFQRTDYINNFSIPFDVKKGEITYVGNIIFNEYANKMDTVISYKNNYERDINALKKLQPTVDWNRAINDINRKVKYKTIE
jgi:hypothetical protein